MISTRKKISELTTNAWMDVAWEIKQYNHLSSKFNSSFYNFGELSINSARAGIRLVCVCLCCMMRAWKVIFQKIYLLHMMLVCSRACDCMLLPGYGVSIPVRVTTFLFWINLLFVCTQQAFCCSPLCLQTGVTHTLRTPLCSLLGSCVSLSVCLCCCVSSVKSPLYICLAVGGYCLSARVWPCVCVRGVYVYVQCVCVCPDLTFSVQFTRFFLAVHSAQRFFPTGTLVHLPLCVCDVFFCVCW